MITKLSRDALNNILSYLSLSGGGGAVALSATCSSLRRDVLAYEDFDECALTQWEGADSCYEQRRKSFPVHAKSYIWTTTSENLPDLERCKVLQVNAIAAEKVLLALPRPEILWQLILDLDYTKTSPLIRDQEDVIIQQCAPVITSERFPNLKMLSYPCARFAPTLPRTITHLKCYLDDELEEGDEKAGVTLEEIFPNLKRLDIVSLSPSLFHLIPSSVERLHIASFSTKPSIEQLAFFENLPLIRILEIDLGASLHSNYAVEKAFLDHVSSSIIALDFAYRNYMLTFQSWEVVHIPARFHQLTVLRMEQPFYIESRLGNPFEGLASLRRVDLNVIEIPEPKMEWQSIIACVFGALPRLRDFRLKLPVVKPSIVMVEMYRHGVKRPEVKVAVVNDFHFHGDRPAIVDEVVSWPGLVYYAGNDLLILKQLDRFPNLKHLRTNRADLGELLSQQRLSPSMRTLELDKEARVGEGRSKDFLIRCDAIFDLGQQLDVIQIDFSDLLRDSDDENRDMFVVSQDNITSFNYANPNLRSSATLVRDDSIGLCIRLKRRWPHGRSLVSRLPPLSEPPGSIINRPWDYLHLFDRLGHVSF